MAKLTTIWRKASANFTGAGNTSLLAAKQVLNKRQGVMFIAIFALVGISLLIATRAATAPVAFEPETGVLAAGATSVANANASGGRALAFAGAATPVPTPPPVAGIYGAGMGFDTKANIVVNAEESFAMKFKAGATSTITGIQWTQRMGGTGYSLGTGGTTTVSIQADNGSGKPNGTKLGQGTWSGGNNPAGEERHEITSMSPHPSITAGKIYYVVFENPSASNYISGNEILSYDGHAGPRQPHFSDADFGILIATSYGGAWSDTANSAQAYTPVVDIIYANGYHDGNAYYEAMIDYPGFVTGTSSMLRQGFTISGGNRSVSSAGVRTRRNSGTGNLNVTLETGAGAVLASGTIPASSVPISQPYLDNGGSVWATANFGTSVNLTNGANYRIRLSSAAGTTYSMHGIRNAAENYYGFKSYAFAGYGEKTTNGGSTWLRLLNGTQWAAEDIDLQFYLK